MDRIPMSRFERPAARARAGAALRPAAPDRGSDLLPVDRPGPRVLEARRAMLVAEGCPVRTRRIIESWLALRRGWSLPRRLRLHLEWVVAVAAPSRGTKQAPRTLRYVGVGTTVDLQIRGTDASLVGGLTLHMAVHPAVPGATVEVRVPHHGPPRRATLDGDGTVSIRLTGRPRSIAVTLRTPSVPSLRLPVVELD